jgi:N-acetylmuramic acid 6-phosphate etherase
VKEPLPQTEAHNAETAAMDALATRDLVDVLAHQQRTAPDAVAGAAGEIAEVVDAIVARIARGGRLHYVGAGTSGRLAVLDAAEMPPTFGTPPDLVRAHVAGGDAALRRAVEGAEDDGDAGEAAMRDVVSGDAVIGISASGGAAYVVRALNAARARGAYTAALVSSDHSPLAAVVDRAIVLRTGPEPIAGSTRLKAGTAQKIALNTISTAVMVRLGKVHGNLMVDVVPTNQKLRLRALRLVMHLAKVDETRAASLLDRAGARVKVAVVMQMRRVDADEALRLLDEAGGVLRSVIE